MRTVNSNTYSMCFCSGNSLHSSQFDEQWRKTVANEQKCPVTTESYHFSIEQITATELESALKMIQTSGKSEDPDGLHPLMLKQARGQFKYTFLILFSICLTAGDYIFKKGKVIFSRKSYISKCLPLNMFSSWLKVDV